MLQVFKKPQVWVYPVLAVGLWAFFAFAMPDVLEFWEKNQLFRFSSDYWHFFDHEPFGTLIYLHTFLIQFNYYTWLGAIVYALLFTLTAFLFNRCINTESEKWVLPGVLSVFMLIPTTINFGLLMPMIVFFVLSGAQLWIHKRNSVVRYLYQFAVLVALTYLIREFTIWCCLFYISLNFYYAKQNKDGLFEKKQWKKFSLLIFPALCGTILSIVLGIWIYRPYNFIVFHSLFKLSILDFSPSLSIPYNYFKIRNSIFIGISIFVAITLASAFYSKIKSRFWIVWIVSFILITTSIFVCFETAEPMQNFQKVDRLCRNYQWTEALQQLNKQWEKRGDFSFSESENLLFFGQTKIVLLATRTATSRLYSFPQPIFPMLFPGNMLNRPECILLPTYYTYIGYFAESLHLGYDLVTCHAISANVLNLLIRTSLIMNDTLPAFKLNYYFENSLFYRKQAALYKNSKKQIEQIDIQYGKQMTPKRDYTVKGYLPDINVQKQHIEQPQNPYFYEYFICIHLFTKSHNLIMDELPNIKKFYHKGGLFVAPRHIQEALLACFDYSPSRYLYPQKIEGVSQEVWNDYWHFIADNQAYLNGQSTFAELQKKWGKTYWFYDCYLTFGNLSSNLNQSVN